MNATIKAPSALTLVVETSEKLYFGKFDSMLDDKILLRDGLVHPVAEGDDRERTIREVLRWGLAPEHRYLAIPTAGVLRVRRLEDL